MFQGLCLWNFEGGNVQQPSLKLRTPFFREICKQQNLLKAEAFWCFFSREKTSTEPLKGWRAQTPQQNGVFSRLGNSAVSFFQSLGNREVFQSVYQPNFLNPRLSQWKRTGCLGFFVVDDSSYPVMWGLWKPISSGLFHKPSNKDPVLKQPGFAGSFGASEKILGVPLRSDDRAPTIRGEKATNWITEVYFVRIYFGNSSFTTIYFSLIMVGSGGKSPTQWKENVGGYHPKLPLSPWWKGLISSWKFTYPLLFGALLSRWCSFPPGGIC